MMIFIDFEYHSSAEKFPHPVCMAALENGIMRTVWLDGNPAGGFEVRQMLPVGSTLVSYQAGAEARCLRALGIDPMDYQWVDAYLEFRQAQNCNNRAEYGTYFRSGMKRRSIPPTRDKVYNRGKDNNPIGAGLADAVGVALGIDIDQRHKDAMRDLILSMPLSWTAEQQFQVLDYCASDIVHLPRLLEWCEEQVLRFAGEQFRDRYRAARYTRGLWSVQCALMEERGIPLDVEGARHLGDNYALARDEIIQDLLAKGHAPFFQRVGRGDWVCKYEAFAEYLQRKGLATGWPLTDSGKFSMENDVLKDMEGDEGIRDLREAMKAIKQLAWFRPEASEKVWRNVGSDGRLRVFLSPFGTQTGRNAPAPSKGYIPAMSSWLRALIRPPEGRAIIGIDYASQEFATAAIVSGDQGMMEAYRSGDPYLHFAKLTGSVPPDGTKKTHKFERNLAKSTVLGLQYGMGAAKLARKLTVDTGKVFTEAQARQQIEAHRLAFPRLWSWRDGVARTYERKHCVGLPDDWLLLGDNDSPLSVANFPIQGVGSTILREAVRLAWEDGIGEWLLFPLHDAIYMEAPADLAEQFRDRLDSCMHRAVVNILGDKLEVRRDSDIHYHQDTWVEEKGEAWFRKLRHNLAWREKPSDRWEKMRSWLDIVQ